MVVPTEQTEVRSVYVTCRLGKSELSRLFNLASEGIPAASTTISTQRDSTRYSAGTLTDLIDHISSSNASGNLDVWDNLALEADDTTGNRKITINIDTERVEVQVSGQDATWVHGQAARAELLLKGAGGSNKGTLDEEQATQKRVMLFTLALMPLLIGGGAAGAYAFKPEGDVSDEERFTSLIIGTLVGIAPVFLVLFAILAFLIRTNRARLTPTEEVPHGSWWSRSSNADKIALSALIVASLSFVVALATLGKDLLG
ncbi:hypothetical protein AB0C88_09825 [Streptomyces chartreusis]|uniref:hypothetical protein n=1 Tax=Streptomyces chartreusis TaxID=1969 RepID=UPI0033C32F97